MPWQVSFAAGTASGVAAASSSLDKAAGSASEEAESGAAAASSVCTAAEAGAGALKEGVDFHIDDFTQKGPEKLLDDDITGFTEVTMELKMRKSPAKQQKLQPPPQPKRMPKKAFASPTRGPSRPAPSPPLEPPPPWWKIPESRSDDGAGDSTGYSTGSAKKRQADNDKNDDNGDRGRVTEQWRPRPCQERGRFGNRGGKLKEWWKAFHHAKQFGKESLDAFLVAHPKPIS